MAKKDAGTPHRRASDKPIDEAARHAVAVGTATVLSPATALFRRETVDEMLAKVSVESL